MHRWHLHKMSKHQPITIEDIGDPFCEHSSNLLVLDSRDLVDTAVVDTLNQI